MANETEINPFTRDPAASTGDIGLDAFLNQGEYAPAPQEDELVDLSQYLPTAAQLAPPQTPMRGVNSKYENLFHQAESKHGLPMGLLSTIGFHESGFNPEAVSSKGAAGVMQLMPGTAKEYGVNPYDTPAAINAAGKKIAHLKEYYQGDLTKAVAAYNWGEGNLDKAIKKSGDNWLSTAPKDTQKYVSNIFGGASTQEPQAELYDIPLSDGSTLHAPIGMPREEAIAKAQTQGINAVGLKDIVLADKSILHAPDTMSDEEAVAYANEHNPGMDFSLPKIETPSRTTGQAIKDIGTTALKGATGAVQGLVGLADLITPGNLGQAVQDHVVDLNKIQQHLTTQFSPQQQEALNNISNAHGFTNILQAVKDNPTGALEMIGESIPQMIGGGLGAKGVMYGLEKLATKVPNLASHIAKWGAYEAAGAGEAAMGGGSAKENLRVINPEGEQTGVNTTAALGTAAGTALFGTLGAKATTALGGVDPTVLLMGQARKAAQQEFGDVAATPGFFKSALVSMIGEGGLQEAPQSAIEQMYQNYATDKPLLDGVEDATVKGGIIGALTGAGAHIGSHVLEGTAPEGTAPEGTVPEQPPAPEGTVPEQPPAPEGTVPEGTAPEGTAPEQPPAPEGTAPEQPPAPEGEIPEPTVRKTDEYQVPKDKHWADTLGITPTSGLYKQLKQLDINDTDHHPYIKNILDNIARKNMKQDPAAVEKLYTHMDAMSTEEANKQKIAFAETLGYGYTPKIDRSGRVAVNLMATENEALRKAVHRDNITQTIGALIQSKNPIIQWIALKTGYLKDLNIRTDYDIKELGKKKVLGGYYDHDKHTVNINPDYAANEWVVGHELLHANVYHAIENPTPKQRPAVMGLMKLHDTVKDHPTLAKEYGVKDVHEFVSEGLNNPEFKYKLNKIKYENTTMWGKFTQTIANILGAKRDNAFMELLTHTEALMPNKPEHRTQGPAQIIMTQEQGGPNANKISETTTPNVSRGTQPEVRQEGQGTPISSEGVRESRPEAGQTEKEKDLTHLTFGDLGNRSNALQDKIEEIEKRLDDQGMSYAEQDRHPELQRAYAERIAMDTQAAKKGYQGSKAILENVLRGLPEDSTYGSHKGLLRDAFSLTPDANTGAYMMAKYTSQALNNKASTIKEMVKHIEPLLLAKSHPTADFHATMGSNMSGLTQAGKDAIHSEAKQLAEESFDKIKDFFTDKVATPKEKQVSAVGIEGPKSEVQDTHLPPKQKDDYQFMEVPPDLQEQAKVLTDAKLVKTSDKTVLDAAKESFKNLTSNTISGIYTRLQTSIVDSSAGLRQALSSLDTFSMDGKLRADLLHSKNQQIFNTINTSFKTGALKFSSAGGLIATDNKNLALNNIFKRIDSLGYADNRSTFFTLMRTLAGEQILRADAINRGKARDMLDAAKDLEFFSNMVQDKVQYKKALDDAATLRKEANRILDRLGVEVNEGKGREKLVQDAHIKAAKTLMAQDDRLGPIMADIYSLLDNCVDLWEQSGLVDKDTANMWRDNPAYLPLYKSMDDLLDNPMEYISFLKSSAKSENKVHTLKGGTHAVNVGENLVKHITFMSGAAAQNQYRKTAVGQLWQLGAAYSTGPNDKQAVMYKHNGKKYYAHIDDPMTLEALETAVPSLSSWAKHAKKATKVFRTVTLANPLYWYRQLVRDPLHANLISQTGVVTPYHALKAFVKILANKSETYNILEKHGVVGAVDSLSDPKEFIKAIASTPNEFRKAGDKWMKVHESADAATRVAVFEAAVKEAKKRGITKKEDIENFAAMRAREIINFSKVGNAQAIASIRATVPFFSAQLNSMDTLVRAATGMGLNKKEAARAKKLFIQRATVLATVSALWAMQMQDDDDYVKSPDWINSWLVPTGDKHNPFFKIPIPFEAGFFFKVLPELTVRLLSGTITPKAAKKDVRDAAINLLLPPLPLSQVLKPIGEVVTNYDLHTGRPIESVADSKLTREQRDSKASDLAKFIAKGVPISPNNIEHLGRGYLTELWATTAALAETMLHTGPSTPEKYLSEMPFLKGIFTRPDQDTAVNRLYDVYKEASEMHNTVKHARKVGEKSVAEDLMADPKNAKLFSSSRALTKKTDHISKLRRNIEQIKNTPDSQINPAEKKNRIQIIQRQINNIAEQGVTLAKERGLDM